MSTAVIELQQLTKKKAAIMLAGIAVVLLALGSFGGNAGIVFAILAGLMLTGMPISISLGLTVQIGRASCRVTV